MAALAPRPLLLIEPVDHMGQPLTRARADRALAWPLEAHRQAAARRGPGGTAGFAPITPPHTPDAVLDRLTRWIAGITPPA